MLEKRKMSSRGHRNGMSPFSKDSYTDGVTYTPDQSRYLWGSYAGYVTVSFAERRCTRTEADLSEEELREIYERHGKEYVPRKGRQSC
jgi:hypothetical protein